MKAESKLHLRPLHAKGRILDQQHFFFLISATFHASSFSNRTNPSYLFYINNSLANTDSIFSAMIFEKKKNIQTFTSAFSAVQRDRIWFQNKELIFSITFVVLS